MRVTIDYSQTKNGNPFMLFEGSRTTVWACPEDEGGYNLSYGNGKNRVDLWVDTALDAFKTGKRIAG